MQTYLNRFFALAISVLALSACSRSSSLTAQLTPRSLKAINLEETISGRDELMLAYTLTSYDAQNKAVAVVNGGWGIQSVRKGQQIDLQSARDSVAPPINLSIPRNGKLIASVVLLEVDDYQKTRQLLDQVRRVHNVVSAPAMLLLSATELLTPLKYVAAGMAASGVGVSLLDRLDKDDLIGQSSLEISEAELRRSKQRLINVPAQFSGRHLQDSFAYELTYDLRLKTAKIRPGRQ
ncbi:hypothetical protein [Spirosoma sp. KUDC1026]|uniref:hypothetical protein n=1 Tax=Spirosoma sp. KUDC1026 TaxID=2745947 RepID=UPI00159BC997|nr:hypothetical protein [Spirosoma sp. KUDC1026]QKZ14810.1 hypothetical protein HU175_20140 [Spirosoma sp. KUDC1026]